MPPVFLHSRGDSGATTEFCGKFRLRRVSIVNRRVELKVTRRKNQLRNIATAALETSVELTHLRLLSSLNTKLASCDFMLLKELLAMLHLVGTV